MKYCLIFIVSTCFFLTHVQAQQKQKIKFSSYNSFGFLAGQKPIAFAAQTENGIAYKNWFLGAGIGFDKYAISSIPLFISIKRKIKNGNNAILICGNFGTNIMAKDYDIVRVNYKESTIGGLYAEVGLGYTIPLSKKVNLFFSLSNTVKQIKVKGTYTDFLGMPSVFESSSYYNRLSFKAGFCF